MKHPGPHTNMPAETYWFCFIRKWLSPPKPLERMKDFIYFFYFLFTLPFSVSPQKGSAGESKFQVK